MINEDGRIVVDSGEPESSLLTKIPEYKHILDELSIYAYKRACIALVVGIQ